MSEVISLSTFHNHNLTDQDHALFMQTVTSQSGLFYGCEVTLKDENTLHVSTGEGIACGRIFRIMDMDYPVELSASGDLLGRLYVHINTALDDTPAQLMDVQGSTLPALIQEDDMNQSTGVYEIELATFSINELGISNLEFTAPKATGGGAGGKSIAPDYSATESYEIGRIFFQNGTLYKTIAAIPAGAPVVLDTNVIETSLAAEIEALNQNLTNCCVYNPTDDWIYISNTKWKKAFLQSLIYFNDTLGYNAEDFGTIAHTISGNGVSCSGSSNIQSSYIEFNATGNLTVTTGASTYTGCSQFTSSEYVDITAYDKLVVQGVYKANSAPPYYIGYLRVKIVDANGNITQLTNIQSNNGNANKNIDVELDLTQYSGEYKLQFEFASSFTSCTAGEHVTNNFKLNNCYFM